MQILYFKGAKSVEIIPINNQVEKILVERNIIKKTKMISLKSFEFIELTWFRNDSFGRDLTLKFDDDELAKLKFPSIFSYKANFETSAGSWTIRKKGMFKPVLNIYRSGEKTTYLSMPYSFNRGTQTPITFPSLNIYQWKRVNMWDGTYGWYQNDELIFELKTVISLKKKRITTSFKKADLSEEDLSILLLIGTYLLVIMQQGGAS